MGEPDLCLLTRGLLPKESTVLAYCVGGTGIQLWQSPPLRARRGAVILLFRGEKDLVSEEFKIDLVRIYWCGLCPCCAVVFAQDTLSHSPSRFSIDKKVPSLRYHRVLWYSLRTTFPFSLSIFLRSVRSGIHYRHYGTLYLAMARESRWSSSYSTFRRT